MMKIYKHTFPVGDSEFPYCGGPHSIDMPTSSKVIKAQVQHGAVTMWFTVPNIEGFTGKFTRRFQFFVTGFEEVPDDAKYIETFQFFDGKLVLHLFEVK